VALKALLSQVNKRGYQQASNRFIQQPDKGLGLIRQREGWDQNRRWQKQHFPLSNQQLMAQMQEVVV